MCLCNPIIKTPWCGKLGCLPPNQEGKPMSQNPLERAIETMEKIKQRNDGMEYTIDNPGLILAISICQRILDEDTEKADEAQEKADKKYLAMMNEFKPCEPAKEKWEVVRAEKENYDGFKFLDLGYEPFAIDDESIWFKRLVPCEKE